MNILINNLLQKYQYIKSMNPQKCCDKGNSEPSPKRIIPILCYFRHIIPPIIFNLKTQIVKFAPMLCNSNKRCKNKIINKIQNKPSLWRRYVIYYAKVLFIIIHDLYSKLSKQSCQKYSKKYSKKYSPEHRYLSLLVFLENKYNAARAQIMHPIIPIVIGLVCFRSSTIGNVCTINIAPPKVINIPALASILDSSLLSRLFIHSLVSIARRLKSSLVATPSKAEFKACTCASACFSGTPLVTKSLYTCKVSICAIVNHLIKSVSNTISMLSQNVNTFFNFKEGIYTWQ